MKKIIVYGPGCPRCNLTEDNARKAVEKLGLEAEIGHVHDPSQFAKNGVLMTPAVTVDGEMKFHGKVPTVEQLEATLSDK